MGGQWPPSQGTGGGTDSASKAAGQPPLIRDAKVGPAHSPVTKCYCHPPKPRRREQTHWPSPGREGAETRQEQRHTEPRQWESGQAAQQRSTACVLSPSSISVSTAGSCTRPLLMDTGLRGTWWAQGARAVASLRMKAEHESRDLLWLMQQDGRCPCSAQARVPRRTSREEDKGQPEGSRGVPGKARLERDGTWSSVPQGLCSLQNVPVTNASLPLESTPLPREAQNKALSPAPLPRLRGGPHR